MSEENKTDITPEEELKETIEETVNEEKETTEQSSEVIPELQETEQENNTNTIDKVIKETNEPTVKKVKGYKIIIKLGVGVVGIFAIYYLIFCSKLSLRVRKVFHIAPFNKVDTVAEVTPTPYPTTFYVEDEFNELNDNSEQTDVYDEEYDTDDLDMSSDEEEGLDVSELTSEDKESYEGLLNKLTTSDSFDYTLSYVISYAPQNMVVKTGQYEATKTGVLWNLVGNISEKTFPTTKNSVAKQKEQELELPISMSYDNPFISLVQGKTEINFNHKENDTFIANGEIYGLTKYLSDRLGGKEVTSQTTTFSFTKQGVDIESQYTLDNIPVDVVIELTFKD